MVTDNSKRLIKVFVQTLNEDDKREVIQFVKEYNESNANSKLLLEQRTFSTAFKNLGPVSGVCAYCGK